MRTAFIPALFFLPALASAAGLDCTQAATPQEKAICASPQLSKADDDMAAAYKDVLAAVPAGVAEQIEQDQHDWLDWLRAYCGYAVRVGHGSWIDCMLDPYQARVDALQRAVFTQDGVKFLQRTVTRYKLDERKRNAPETGSRSNAWRSDFATLSASWPQATVDQPEWKAWNAAMELAARKQQTAEADGGDAAPWQAVERVNSTVTATIQLLSGHLVVVSIQNNWDAHGAHPNQNSGQFNWLLQEQRELKPTDVFRAGGPAWDEFFYRQCDLDLHLQLDSVLGASYDEFFPRGQMKKVLHSIVADPVNWQIGSDGIAIIYQDDVVACHACRPHPTQIPWNAMGSYLKKTFEIPKPDDTPPHPGR